MKISNLPSYSLQDIIAFLNENDYKFDIHGQGTNDLNSFTLANFYNIINKGLYFNIGGSSKYLSKLRSSVILSDTMPAEQYDNIIILVDYPQEIHYILTSLSAPQTEYGIHPTAIIGKNSQIAPDVAIGPYTVIEDHVIIGSGVTIGGGSKIYSNTLIKTNTTIDYNCNIGTSGMSWVWGRDGSRIIQPQLGGVIIEEDCVISTDISIVRGTLSECTTIGKGTVIAHGSKIGHGCQIGSYVHFANNVSLAGNAQIGDNSFLGSACVVSVGVKIPSSTIVGAGAVVTKNFSNSFLTLAGVPAKIIKQNNYLTKPTGAPQPKK